MQVILLERIARLGQMGDTVKVRDGYARNFLLPQGKALRANKANLERFENERAQLEARNLERKSEARSCCVQTRRRSSGHDPLRWLKPASSTVQYPHVISPKA